MDIQTYGRTDRRMIGTKSRKTRPLAIHNNNSQATVTVQVQSGILPFLLLPFLIKVMRLGGCCAGAAASGDTSCSTSLPVLLSSPTLSESNASMGGSFLSSTIDTRGDASTLVPPAGDHGKNWLPADGVLGENKPPSPLIDGVSYPRIDDELALGGGR
jgi:hypothetical protein